MLPLQYAHPNASSGPAKYNEKNEIIIVRIFLTEVGRTQQYQMERK